MCELNDYVWMLRFIHYFNLIYFILFMRKLNIINSVFIFIKKVLYFNFCVFCVFLLIEIANFILDDLHVSSSRSEEEPKGSKDLITKNNKKKLISRFFLTDSENHVSMLKFWMWSCQIHVPKKILAKKQIFIFTRSERNWTKKKLFQN